MRLQKLIPSGIKRSIYGNFPLWEKLGMHVTPNHFYSPIPDTAKIPEETWVAQQPLTGVDLRESEQVKLVEDFASRFKSEYEAFPEEANGQIGKFYLNNGMVPVIDAMMMYCMVRSQKPGRIIEIGSGHSTCAMAEAAEANRREGVDCRFTAIEPYPKESLRKGFPGLTDLRTTAVQDVPLEVFQELGENDILFIDSSHVAKIGSDVLYEFLSIIPSLRPGVFVHVHDIFFPYDYPRQYIKERRWFWNEQYLLQAFLAFNSAFKVIWTGHLMAHRHPETLAKAYSRFKGNAFPCSFWMQRVPHC